MPKKTQKKRIESPRIAHVDFYVEKERQFVKYVKYLSSPLHIMWRNFLVGTFQGLGFVIGSALFIALFGWFTTKVLGEIPLFSDLANALDFWLEHNLTDKK